MMRNMLSDADLDTIFRQARSHKAWHDKNVPDVTLEAVYDLMRWGPTSVNSCPIRIVFVKSAEGKERLMPHVAPNNVETVATAPVTAIIAYDVKFYEWLPRLFAEKPEARNWFAGDENAAWMNAFRNGTLQGAYFIIAARALGLDCAPLSGFDNAGVDTTFFSEGRVRSNFLCALGYGRDEALPERPPRPAFGEVCTFA